MIARINTEYISTTTLFPALYEPDRTRDPLWSIPDARPGMLRGAASHPVAGIVCVSTPTNSKC